MAGLAADISKYLILILMALYTVMNFYAMRKIEHVGRGGLYRRQLIIVFVIHFLGYLIIYLNTKDVQMLLFYAVQLAFFLIYILAFNAIYKFGSRILLSNTIMFLTIGMVMLTRLDVDRAIKQFIMIVAFSFATLAVPAIIKHVHALSNLAWLFAIVGIAALGAVWLFGNTSYGAQLSFSLGGITLQPSEFIKLTFVFFVAAMFRKNQSFIRVFITTIIAGAHVLILIASTDLGSGLVYFVSYIFMLFVATRKWYYLAGGAAAGCGAAVAAYYAFDHVRVRVSIWRDPFADYEGKGYQLAQSLFAISSGGWFGLGLYQGTPNSIPLASKDVIFSAISEEFGAIFSICLILIYLGYILQMMWIATWMRTTFYRIIGFGFAVMLGIQVFLHVGGVIKMIPMTGITLPLISYGGSSIASTLIIIGVIQGLFLMHQEELKDERMRQMMRDERHYEGQV